MTTASDNVPAERPLFSAAEFFASQPPPVHLQEHLDHVREFVQRNASEGRRVVLVTSGGTTVPLEHNVVRFLDNFSAGTRGSASAEYFLATGSYAVIFLHRQHSLQPFSRHYSHSTNPFLDLLEVVESPKGQEGKTEGAQKGTEKSTRLFPPVPAAAPHSHPGTSRTNSTFDATGGGAGPLFDPNATTSPAAQVRIKPPHRGPMLSLLRSYKLVKSLGILHSIPFTTVDEYLFFLRGVSEVMGNSKDERGVELGRRGMYYLAAAVSDFFIPRQRMSEHKIQSGKGSLIIEMDQVPKVLKAMVDEWSNEGYIVSFKLETDPSLLIPKARVALERYGHQVVIANDLAERKHEVVFVDKSGEEWVRIEQEEREKIGEGGEVREIEKDIVERLVRRHGEWIESGLRAVE